MSKSNQTKKDKRIVVRTTLNQLEAIKKHSMSKELSLTEYVLGLIYKDTKEELLKDYANKRF